MRGSHLVITVHGIRTFGQWQERLENLVTKADPNIEFINYKYGYFSVLAFLIPFLRWLVVRRFRKELVERYEEAAYTRVDLVGHSFGTHVLSWAIAGLPRDSNIRIHTVILSGSVLRAGFGWHELLGKRVKRIVNDCGARDKILLLSQFFVLFTGMAGRMGFSGGTSASFRNRYSLFGHSGYFVDAAGQPSDDYMVARWVPLFFGDQPVPPFDERQPSFWEGPIAFLGNNAEPIKIMLYASPFIALKFYVYGLYGEADAQRENALRQQSLMAASVAEQRMAEGDSVSASVLALSSLPDDVSGKMRPYVEKAAKVLFQSLAKPQAVARVADAGVVAAISPDERYVAVGTSPGDVLLYRADTWARIKSTRFANAEVAALQFSKSGKYLAVAFKTDKAAVYTTESMELLFSVQNLSAGFAVTSIAFSPDERTVVAGDGGGNLILTEIETKLSKYVVKAHPSGVLRVSFSPDGTSIVTCGARDAWLAGSVPDSHVKVWSAGDLSPIADLDHRAWALTYAVSPDSKHIATVGDGGIIRIWDMPSGTERSKMSHRQGLVRWIYFIDQSTIAITNGSDVEVVDTQNKHRNQIISRSGPTADVVEFTAGGDAIFLSKNDRTLLRFVPVGQIQRAMSYRDMRFVSFAANPTGSLTVGVGPDGVAAWRRTNQKAIPYFWADAEPSDVAKRAVSRNGLRSAVIRRGPAAESIHLYDHDDGNGLELALSGFKFVDVTLSGDGKLLATSSIDIRTGLWAIHLWDANDGASKGLLSTVSTRVDSLKFNADGSRLAVSLQNGVIELYSTVERKLMGRTQTKFPYGDVDVSSDGRYLIHNSSSGDVKEAMLFDTRDGSTHAIPVPGNKDFGFAGFLDDGRLALGPTKGPVAIADPSLQGAISMLGEKNDIINWVARSASSRSVAIITAAGLLSVYDESLRPTMSIVLADNPLRVWFDEMADIAIVKFAERLEAWSLSQSVRIDSTALPPDSEILIDWKNRSVQVAKIDGGIYEDDLLARVDPWVKFTALQAANPRKFVDFARIIVLDELAKPEVDPSKLTLVDKVLLRDAAVTDCDRLTANPYDPYRTRKGVDFDSIDAVVAVRQCKEARKAEPHNARIVYQLGRALSKAGKTQEASTINLEAARMDYPMARYKAAVQALGKPTDASQAFKDLEELAGNGLVAAMVDIGDAYMDGLGVAKDQARAFKIWQRAAAANDPRAHDRLGVALTKQAQQDADRILALTHLIIASVLYERTGVDGSAIAAKRGSLARSMRTNDIFSAIDDAKNELAQLR